MKKYLTIKTFAAAAIMLMLSAVVFATVNYIVNLGLGTKLNPNVKFKIELIIDEDYENAYTVFNNVENNAVSWASFDYATLNLLGEGSPLWDCNSDSVLKLKVTNLNSEYMSFAVLTGENSPITADPEIGLVNIENNGGSGEITIKNQSIITSDFLIAVDGSKYDTEVERSTVSTTGITATLSNSTRYVGYDYVTYLSTNAYDVVDVKSVSIGTTLLNPNEDYVYDSTTGKLKVFASDLTDETTTIECIGKNKKVNVTLTLENCTATHKNQTFNDLTTTTIENISSTKDFVLNFEGNNSTQTAWAFDIHEASMTQIHNYNWEITETAKTLTIPKEVLTTDIIISASVGTAWGGTIASTAYASGTGTEADPFVVTAPSQMAKLAKVVNAGTNNFANQYIELHEDLYLNDELFQFSEETALVKITDANLGNVIYVGTGLTPSNKNVSINGTLNTATAVGEYYIQTAINSFVTAVEGTHYWLSTTADGTEQVFYHTTGSAVSFLDMWEPIGLETAVFYGNTYGEKSNIIGMFINQTYGEVYQQGLFGRANIQVRDLNIGSGCVVGGRTGGIIGQSNSGQSNRSKMVGFYNCSNSATLISNRLQVGGIVGMSAVSDVVNCCNYGVIIASGGIPANNAGGICGNAYGTVLNCFNYGNIFGSRYTGGLVGILGSPQERYHGIILNCYNAGKISALNVKGGLIGLLNYGNINNSYYNDNTLEICGSSSEYSNCVIGENVCTFDKNLTLSKTAAIGFDNSADADKISTNNLLTALNEGAEYINSEADLYNWVLNDAGLPVFGSNLVTIERTYTINFDCSFITNINGTGDSLISDYNGGVKSSEYLPLPTTINSAYTNPNYYFKGWSLNADGSGVLYPYVAPNMTDGSTITLYGVWWEITEED